MASNPWALFGILFAAAALAAVGTGIARRYAIASGMLDVPNDRSSHTIATPRGGGVAIAVVWLSGIGACYVGSGLGRDVLMAVAPGAAGVAALGFWDDHGDVARSVRLLVHVAAAVWAVAWVGRGGEPPFAAAGFLPGLAGSMAAAIGIVWLTNLYNFMDGVDGLAAGGAVVAGIAMGILLRSGGALGLGLAAWLLAASAAGFLIWNWPPARIFMGDVGSGLLGYAFGALALAGHATTDVPLTALLLPFGVFITDATFTLLRRLVRGERVYEAHRSHIYQRLVQYGWSHRAVTTLCMAVTVALSVIAWLVARTLLAPLWGLLAGGALVVSVGSGALRIAAASNAASETAGMRGI